MAKKILKGLKDLKIFPITKNDKTAYTTGPAVQVPSIQSLGLEPDVSEWKINADDDVYETGSDWNGMKITFQFAEMPLELKKYFEGGEWDETKKEYSYKSSSIAPEIGASFKSLMSDGNYRMVKLYALRCSKVKGDYKTKGEGDKGNPIQVEGIVTQRSLDSEVKTEKDSTSPADFTWLNSLDAAGTP